MGKKSNFVRNCFLVTTCCVLWVIGLQIAFIHWFRWSQPEKFLDYPSSLKPIHFVIPTVSRRYVQHKYIQSTFQSLYNSFQPLGVNFHVHSYEHGANLDKVPVISNRFHYNRIQHPDKFGTTYWRARDQIIQKQNLDWIGMMNHYYKDTCSEEIFIYLEDDFEICNGAALHLLRLYHWMLRNSTVNGIKFSYGGSGMILRCKHLDRYIATVRLTLMGEKPKVIDWALADTWSTYRHEGNNPFFIYIYRFNLFWHIGRHSSIGNIGNKHDDFRKNQLKCFGKMTHPSVYSMEHFNLFECVKSLVYPCDSNTPSLEKLGYVSAQENMVDFPNFQEYIDMKGMVGKVGQTCDDTCHSIKRTCSSAGYPLFKTSSNRQNPDCNTTIDRTSPLCPCLNTTMSI